VTAIFSAIVPIFMLLALGASLRWRKFPGNEFWRLLDPLVYYLLFPALLLSTFAKVDLASLSVWRPGLAVLSAMAMASLALLLGKRWFTLDGPAFAALLQGTVRFNAYLGFAIATLLFGHDGLTQFSIVTAFVTPAANVISVLGLNRYGASGPRDLFHLFTALVSNPMILAVLAGVALNLSGIGLPWALGPFFEVLGRAALPMGLLAAGAGLEIAALKSSGATAVLGSACRLAAMPVLALSTCWIFDIEGVMRLCILIYACAPVPPGAYILARQLGGDAPLTAAMISISTLLALLTMPAWLYWAG
jgi:predicted permease